MDNQCCRGSALLTALFIMTLVAIAATAMSLRLQLDIYRTNLTITSNKLYLASQSVPFWAMNTLSLKKNNFFSSDANGKIRDFPAALQKIYPDILVQGALYDLQNRFNLNNLRDKKYQATFLNLLETALPSMDTEDQKALLRAIEHWITPYEPAKDEDKLLEYYLHQHPPYLSAHQLMKSISELRLIKNVTSPAYQILESLLTVLPEKTPININTAPIAVLKSLGNGLNKFQVNEIIEARGESGIFDIKKIVLILKKMNIPLEQVTTKSQYFLSIATTTSKNLSLKRFTILKRNQDKKGRISVSIIQDSLHTL